MGYTIQYIFVVQIDYIPHLVNPVILFGLSEFCSSITVYLWYHYKFSANMIKLISFPELLVSVIFCRLYQVPEGLIALRCDFNVVFALTIMTLVVKRCLICKT